MTESEMQDTMAEIDTRDAERRAMIENCPIKVGKTYRINPLYDFHKRVIVRVTYITLDWVGEGDIRHISVFGYRVRPNELNVSFGNEVSYTARLGQFELLRD